MDEFTTHVKFYKEQIIQCYVHYVLKVMWLDRVQITPIPPSPPSPEDISLVFSEKYKYRVTTNHLPSIYTLHVLT